MNAPTTALPGGIRGKRGDGMGEVRWSKAWSRWGSRIRQGQGKEGRSGNLDRLQALRQAGHSSASGGPRAPPWAQELHGASQEAGAAAALSINEGLILTETAPQQWRGYKYSSMKGCCCCWGVTEAAPVTLAGRYNQTRNESMHECTNHSSARGDQGEEG